jgi:hypothetical protein
MKLEAPDWRGSLEEILNGIDNELRGPTAESAVLEDLKVMLDNTRNVIQAFMQTDTTAAYLKELRDIRVRRTVGVCQNVLSDVRAGRVERETLGLVELREVLDDVTAQLNVGDA